MAHPFDAFESASSNIGAGVKMQKSILMLAFLAIASASAHGQTEDPLITGNAAKGITVCPLAPLPDRGSRPVNLRVFDPRTNTEVTDRDQMDALSIYELRADASNPYYCTESTMEVVIEKSLGYPSEAINSKACQGPNCKSFTVKITTQPGRAFYWKARIWRRDRCYTDSVCHADDAFSYRSDWHDGPPLRAKDFWATNVGHNIVEHFNVKGEPRGDESEGSRSQAKDDVYMNYGSALDDDQVNQTVSWITPVKLDNRYNAVDGELYYISKADAACEQVLWVRDFIEKKDVVLDKTMLPANKSLQVHAVLPKGLRRYVTPITNVLDKSASLPIYASCKGGKKPFVYGADLIMMTVTEMAYDEAGSR